MKGADFLFAGRMNQLRNLITDIPGLRVGNAEDAALGSGVTVALFDEPAVVSFFAMGGAPATRETDLLDPDKMVPGIHGVVLSGGSAFGLDAASGVQAFLRERGIGFAVRDALVPLVSQASSFDLVNGGNKNWGRYPPYRELGYEAALNAGLDFALGTAGGGYGATTANLKGGLGSTSAVTSAGHAVGALVVVNSVSSAVIGNGPHFWAGALEEDEEFGGHGHPYRVGPEKRKLIWKGGPQPATTIALVATDAVLTKARPSASPSPAMPASPGPCASLTPCSTATRSSPAATGRRPLREEASEFTELTALAADCLTRAIARGVYEATALPYPGAQPAWRDLFEAT